MVVLHYANILNWIFLVLGHWYIPQVDESNTKFINYDRFNLSNFQWTCNIKVVLVRIFTEYHGGRMNQTLLQLMSR